MAILYVLRAISIKTVGASKKISSVLTIKRRSEESAYARSFIMKTLNTNLQRYGCRIMTRAKSVSKRLA